MEEVAALNGQNINSPAGEPTTKDLIGAYTQISNTVLLTPTLSSHAKVAYAILYATYTYAKDTNKLVDGAFYCSTERLAEHMNISTSQIRKKVLPEIINAGLVEKCGEKMIVNGKYTNAYRINLDAVKNFNGIDNSKEVEAKSIKGKKAQEGKVAKEDALKREYYGQFLYVVSNATRTTDEALTKSLSQMIMSEHPEYVSLQNVMTMVRRIGCQVFQENKDDILARHQAQLEEDENERFNRFIEKNFGGAAEYYEENYAHDTCEQDEFDDDEDYNPPF